MTRSNSGGDWIVAEKLFVYVPRAEDTSGSDLSSSSRGTSAPEDVPQSLWSSSRSWSPLLSAAPPGLTC